MAETLVARVRNRVGTYTNATQLLEWLELGVRRAYENMPRLMTDRLMSSYSISSAGMSTTKYVIKSFSYYGPGRFITLDMKYLISNGSIHAGTNYSPVGYFQNEKFYTFPKSGCTAQALSLPSLASTDTTITRFPYEYDEIPVLYASIQAVQTKINTLLESVVGGLSWNSQVPPSTIIDPSFLYEAASQGLISPPEIAFTNSIAYTPIALGLSYSAITSALADEDEELVRAAGEKLQIELEEIQKELLNNLNIFNESVEKAKIDLQEAITQAQLSLEESIATAKTTTDVDIQNKAQELTRQIQEYQAKIAKYQTEVSAYAAEINSESARISSLLGAYNIEIQGLFKQIEVLKIEYNDLIQELRASGG